MRQILKVLLLILVIFSNKIYSQKEFLLNINSNGMQEIVPIDSDVKITDALENIKKNNMLIQAKDVVDTLKYFSTYDEQFELNTNFGFYLNDVAFQWYSFPAEFSVKEIWWKNIENQDSTAKIKIRSWKVNDKIFDIPSTAVNANGKLGYYNIECDTCSIKITPFKPDSNSVLNTINTTDTTHLFFDPLLEDYTKLDTTVTLRSNGWQGIKLNNNWSLPEMQPFGFTIQNLSDKRIGLQSKTINNFDSTNHFNPSHSMKFYSTKQNADSTIGWQIKNYDLGMFVVVSLVTDGPFLVYDFITKQGSFIRNHENEVRVKISNYGGLAQPTTVTDVFLKYKYGYSPIFSTKVMNSSKDTFYCNLPATDNNGPLFLYVVAKDIYGNSFHSQVSSYQLVTSVEDKENFLTSFNLFSNYPNPFNPNTTITYEIPGKGKVTLKIYDLLGNEINTLVNNIQDRGKYTYEWNAAEHPSGVYFGQVRYNTFTKSIKLILMK